MKNYTAVIMDIRASKKMEPETRRRCQEKLGRVLGAANDVYGRYMESQAEFSAGDSIQALFRKPVDGLMFCFFVRALMYPFTLYTGAGIGGLTVQVENAGSNAQDGPCYHLAREALEKCGGIKDILFAGGDELTCAFLNNLLFVANVMRSGQTAKQRDLQNLFDITVPVGCERNHPGYIKTAAEYVAGNIAAYHAADADIRLFRKGLEPGWISMASNLSGTTYENVRQMTETAKLHVVRLQEAQSLFFIKKYMK